MKTRNDSVSRMIEQAKSIDLRGVIQLEEERTYGSYKSGRCPFGIHADDSPSLLVYADHYYCLATVCESHGNIFNWFAYKTLGAQDVPKGRQFLQLVETILGTPLPKPVERKPEPEPEPVDLLQLANSYHKILKTYPNRIAYFLSRGFTYKTINRELWGWDGQNYVITVWENKPQESELLCLRFRAAAKSAKRRYSGVTGYNHKVLYNRESMFAACALGSPVLFMFYGELDAKLADQNGLFSVSPTNGALAVDPTWFSKCNNEIILIPDKGEEKAAISDAGLIGPRAWVEHLPPGNFKDFTEYNQLGHTAEDLINSLSSKRLRKLSLNSMKIKKRYQP